MLFPDTLSLKQFTTSSNLIPVVVEIGVEAIVRGFALPAMLLTPGRIGILLMSDVVVGVGSAAALAGEPFGWREATGTVLIVGAAFVEVLGRQKSDVTELR